MAYLDYAGLQRYHGKIEENFAKIDGAYEGMTVGNAEELVTGLEEEESVPFIFRTSGGQLEIGAREDLTVVGGSLVWNQLLAIPSSDMSKTANGVTITDNRDGSYTISTVETGATANTNIRPVLVANGTTKDHKYYFWGFGEGQSASTWYLADAQVPTLNFEKKDHGIANGLATGYLDLHIVVASGAVITTPITVKPCITDLTQMFGSTIADYIYALEQNTAGAGVAFFKKLFPKDYYEYNAGELLSVNASAFKTIGFNQWDTSTDNENRAILNDGTLDINSAYYVSDYIRVLPSTTYYFKDVAPSANANSIAEYDANKNFIRIQTVSGASGTNASGTKVMSDNTHYIRVARFKTSNEVCVFIHWDNTRDGEYEPYVEHSYPLDSDLTLRGIPKLDADNNLYYDGDTYEADGTVTRKYGIVDLGTLTWTAGFNGFITNTNINKKMPTSINDGANLICSRYPSTIYSMSGKDKVISQIYSTPGYTYNGYLIVKDSTYTDAASFKTAMSGVYLVYELATPTTETADPYQKPQIVDNWGTEEFTVTEQSGVAVPVGHNTIYPISLRDKLEAMPNLPSEDGDYILRMRSGEPAYIALANEFPAPPTTDGTYTLKATVSSGVATLTWEEVTA